LRLLCSKFLYDSQAGATDFSFEQLRVAQTNTKMQKPPMLARYPKNEYGFGWMGTSPPRFTQQMDQCAQPQSPPLPHHAPVSTGSYQRRQYHH
jgi:hypothetical protein